MDFLIALFELVASWIVGNKNKIGFILLAISNIGWVVYVFINHHTFGLLLVVVPAFFINIRNWLRWKNETK